VGRTLKAQALDAGASFSPNSPGAHPTLDEVFDALGGRCVINVEMTNYASPRDMLPHRVVAVVRRFQVENRVLLSSFNPFALRSAERLAPDLPLGLLLSPGQPWWMRLVFPLIAPHESLNLHDSLVREETPRRLRRAGRKFIPWTVNNAEKDLKPSQPVWMRSSPTRRTGHWRFERTSPGMLDLRSIREARERIGPHIEVTPARRIGEGPIWLKCENRQRTGSFKIRGALNKVLGLPAEQMERGVVAASAGNHGQGVALAARMRGAGTIVAEARPSR
jgi:hypothetical protein